MATIIEGGLWTLTEDAANFMVSVDLIYKCDGEHNGVLPADLPIYHLNHKRPTEVGISNLHSYIADAERAIEDKKSEECYHGFVGGYGCPECATDTHVTINLLDRGDNETAPKTD